MNKLDSLFHHVSKYWNDENIVSRINDLSKRGLSGGIVFYEGPPFATGSPHYGHAVGMLLKDSLLKWQIQYYNRYAYIRTGWDCHGVPIEYEIQKANHLNSHHDILEFGMARFCEECRSVVFRCDAEWKTVFKSLARWADFESAYMTMSNEYMDVVWKVFSCLWDRGLVYRGKKVMLFSCSLGTALSNFEAQSCYKMVKDKSVFVKVKIEGNSDKWLDHYLIVWTTTPWTIPANTAIAVNKDLQYMFLEGDNQEVWIVSQNSVCSYEWLQYKVRLGVVLGEELVGLKYVPMWSMVAPSAFDNTMYKVWHGDFVEDNGEGSGIVHVAPAFGEDDYSLSVKEGFSYIDHVNDDGRINHLCGIVLQGTYFMEASELVIAELRKQSAIVSVLMVEHRYPHCPRSDTRLIHRLCSNWFIKVTAIKKELIAANERVYWVPEHIKSGRFGKWLESAVDWCVSRSRYWGTPMPIWQSEAGDVLIISSKKDLEQKLGYVVEDLHRHVIDNLEIGYNGVVYKRISAVFDCWFESGSMPYAGFSDLMPESGIVKHSMFPADFIVEGVDQTRGWFYTLLVIGVALFGASPFNNVLVNGTVLAEDGNKMSKRLKNYPELNAVIQKYGGDALRWYLISSPASYGEDLCFEETRLQSVNKDITMLLLNAVEGIFLSYVKLRDLSIQDILDYSCDNISRLHVLDLWILVESVRKVQQIDDKMSNYYVAEATAFLNEWLQSICNWYIRLSKKRFLESESPSLHLLFYVLILFAKKLSPFMPFVAEYVFQYILIENGWKGDSVHFINNMPANVAALFDVSLFDRYAEVLDCIAFVRRIVSLGHAIRKRANIRVRQPLPKITVYGNSKGITRSKFYNDILPLICFELNILQVEFSDNIIEASSFCRLYAKPNYKVVGAKLGSRVSLLQNVLDNLSIQQIMLLSQGVAQHVSIDNEQILLLSEDVICRTDPLPGVHMQADDDLIIVLDCTMSDSLLLEGEKRDVISSVMKYRKTLGLSVDEPIKVGVYSVERMSSEFLLEIKTALDKCGVSRVDLLSLMPPESSGVECCLQNTQFRLVIL